MIYDRIKSLLSLTSALSAKIRTPKNHCLNLECGRPLDGATCVGSKAKPSPGDITICIYCGHIMAYGEKMKLRELTKEEAYDIAGNQAILRIQEARKRLADKTH